MLFSSFPGEGSKNIPSPSTKGSEIRIKNADLYLTPVSKNSNKSINSIQEFNLILSLYSLFYLFLFYHSPFLSFFHSSILSSYLSGCHLTVWRSYFKVKSCYVATHDLFNRFIFHTLHLYVRTLSVI